MKPPRLLDLAEAAYPTNALERKLEATVILRLTIDASGRVTKAEVSTPAGEGFDEAAQAAALRFRFEPAQRGGRPVATRILYAYSFRLPPAATAAPPNEPSAAGRPKESESQPVARGPDPSRAGPPPPAKAVEVTVRGQSAVESRRQSAEAVTVIETRRARQQSMDMGELMNRTQGVAVRRAGGLGSFSQFSLNGLSGDQIRFFLDGVPLEIAGFPAGISTVPINLIDTVEIYRGVVPIRFGADSLGGGINIVTDPAYDAKAGASYQVGAFGTHRATAMGRYRHEPSGFVASGGAFLDQSKNDYRIDVEIADAVGGFVKAKVPRFHDGYTAVGGTIEAGYVDRPWAKRLLVRAYGAGFGKELQHGAVATVPFGEVTYGARTFGSSTRYEQPITKAIHLEALVGYAHRAITLVDKAEWFYNWYGVPYLKRPRPGELRSQSQGTDATTWENSLVGRVNLAWRIAGMSSLRVNLSPTFSTRAGEDRMATARGDQDLSAARRNAFTFLSGIEHELNLFSDRLQHIAFIKDYVLRASSEELIGNFNVIPRFEQDIHQIGVGTGIRFRWSNWSYAKLSYEYATRLPRPDELFGDGGVILPSLELEPERSHNVNIGPRLELRKTLLGSFILDVNAFLRESQNLILLLGSSSTFRHDNVNDSRSIGVEGSLAWTSPGRWLQVEANATFQDFRNTSSDGTFGDYEGDRIPNRPWLFGNFEARIELRPGLLPNDRLIPFYASRYTHEFYRGWESVGARNSKATIPSQFIHGVGASYSTQALLSITSTFEVHNVTDADAFDFYGIQKPGRSYFYKATIDY